MLANDWANYWGGDWAVNTSSSQGLYSVITSKLDFPLPLLAMEQLEHVIDCESRVEQVDDQDPAKPGLLNELGKARWFAWNVTHQNSLLDGAIDSLEQAVQLARSPTGAKVKYQNNLGIFCTARGSEQGLDDLNTAVVVLREALANHTAEIGILDTILLNLGVALSALYHADYNSRLLEEAIQVFQDGLAADPSLTNKPKFFNGLCNSLLSKFDTSRSIDDINHAVESGNSAIEESEESHPERAIFLDTSASALFKRFQYFNDNSDLERAISRGEAAMKLAGPGYESQFTSNFAAYLLMSHRTRNNNEDLEHAIQLLQDVLSQGNISTSVALLARYRFAMAIRFEFEEMGVEENLTLSIDMITSLLGEISESNRLWPLLAVELSNSLLRRFDVGGTEDDIDLAIEILQSSQATLSEDSFQSCDVWVNLSVTLLTRFDIRGSLIDLDEAESAAKVSISILDTDHPAYSGSLVALANVYLKTYQETRQESYLDETIDLYEEALGVSSPWPKLRGGRLASLAYALQLRNSRHKDRADWDRCIQVCHDAIQDSLDVSSSMNQWRHVGQLGNAYFSWYLAHESDPSSESRLQSAILHLNSACQIAPEEHTTKSIFLYNLGFAYELSFKASGEQLEFQSALQSYRQCLDMNSATNIQKATAAYRGLLLSVNEDLSNAVQFAVSAISLLPKLATRLLPRVDQEHMVSLFAGLGSYSAAVLLEAKYEVSKVALALETTRGMVNGSLVETRADLGALETAHPDLAAEFQQLSQQLNRQDFFPTASIEPVSEPLKNWNQRIRVAGRFEELISRIQSLEGFSNVFTPLTESEMKQLASTSTIVMINLSPLRCDAILISKDSIENIKLEAVSFHDVTRNANRLIKALAKDNASLRRKTNDHVKVVLEWLWSAFVSPIYHYLKASEGEMLRICWMPTGYVSLFPLHAAMSSDASYNALDLIVSSYATTFRCLRHASNKKLSSSKLPLHATLVAMEETSNQRRLPFAAQEATLIEALLGKVMFATRLSQKPTKATVMANITKSAVLHMSCHGISDQDEPSASKLLLEDWESNPLSVADLAGHHLPDAQFCYLSACHAASNTTSELLDESLHLTSAMQLAGFPRVVGTLWQVNDRRAMELSVCFWEQLLQAYNGKVEFSDVAMVLNKATRDLREKTTRAEGDESILIPSQPFIWAPFVFYGL